MNIEQIPAISASQRKMIASLQQSRHRRESRLFVAEGAKCLFELIGAFRCRMIVATHAFLLSHSCDMPAGIEIVKGGRADMERISSMSNPPEVIAVMEMPEQAALPDPSAELVLALDDIQDPGNLGAIIRTCDWFGVRTIVCSQATVDIYNPKVVQSTMGAMAHVNVVSADLAAWLESLHHSVPVYGTFLDGEDIYNESLGANGVVVMGNEGRGITPRVAAAVNRRLFIPPFPRDAQHVESLNVSVATAITLAQFRK